MHGLHADHPAVILGAADRAMQARDYAAAAALLERPAMREQKGPDVLLRLAAARRALGDVPGALESAHAAVKTDPACFPALLMVGSLLDALGRKEDAAGYYENALRVAPDDQKLPPAFQAELARGRRRVASDRSWRDHVASVSMPSPQMIAERDITNLEIFRDRILGGPNPDGTPGQFLYPGLSRATFYDPASFANVDALERATSAIVEEFKTVVSARAPELVYAVDGGHHRPCEPATATSTSDNRWTAIHLVADGQTVTDNARYCPKTMALYEALKPPVIAGRSPNLMFSILDPHTQIPPHHGVTNTRLVLHIPLIIPDGCALRVGADTREWVPGRALIFDDTINHEAWNNSDSLRVVLLCDIWHPGLSPVERETVATLMAQQNS